MTGRWLRLPLAAPFDAPVQRDAPRVVEFGVQMLVRQDCTIKMSIFDACIQSRDDSTQNVRRVYSPRQGFSGGNQGSMTATPGGRMNHRVDRSDTLWWRYEPQVDDGDTWR